MNRDGIDATVAPAVARHERADLAALFDGVHPCRAPYRKLGDALEIQGMFIANSLFADVSYLAGHICPTSGAITDFVGHARLLPTRAPPPGGHTEEVLAEGPGLAGHGIARLHGAGTVAGAQDG